MATYDKLYLTSAAKQLAVSNKGVWDLSLSPAQAERKMAFAKAGGGNVGQLSATENSASQVTFMMYRGVSEPLGAQTLSGTLQIAIRIWEGSSAADMAFKLHVWVTVGDTDVVRATLINNYTETAAANEWTTAEVVRQLAAAQAISAAIQAGDRIVAEIGFKAYNTSTSFLSGALNYGTIDPDDGTECPDAVVGTAVRDQAPYLLFSDPISDNSDPNTAPVADAGPDASCGLAGMALAGSAIDDGLPNPPAALTYAWSQVSGPGTAVFVNAANPTTSVSFDVVGVYVLRLTVSDSVLNDTDDVTITVVNQAPVVNAGADQAITLPVNVVNLSGSASDDGLPNPPAALTNTWSMTSGPVGGGVTFGDANALSTTATVTAGLSGVYVIRLTSTDGDLTTFDELTITVDAAPAEVEFPPSEDGETIGLHWIHFFAKTGAHYVWSKVDLPDPAFYYGGLKDGRVMRFGLVKRALSDHRGQYEATTFTWVLADVDRVLRGILSSATTKWMKGRNVIFRTILDEGRRLFETPRTIVRGIVTKARALSPLHFEFTAEDWFASKFRVGKSEQQIPKRLLGRADRPNLPAEQIDKPVPILYGEISDEGSATAPPTITGTPALGAYYDGVQLMGFGALPSAAAPPSGVAAVAAAGGTLSADVPNSEYGIVVTSVDAFGVESDPSPFYYDQANGGSRGSFPAHVPTAVVNGAQKITATWAAGAGAVSYRAYLSTYYYGTRFLQMIQTAALTCDFTANPAFGVPTDASNITPGANLINWTQWWYYAVSAVMADGETGLSAQALHFNRGFRRPGLLEWLAVPSALSYNVYRKPQFGDFDRVWSVPNTDTSFADDLLDNNGYVAIDGSPAAAGLVPVIYVGTEEDVSGFAWHAFLVCGHAVKQILAWYQGGVRVDPGTAGVTWAVPGHANYATYFPNTGSPQYRDINGHRYTFLYVRGPDAEAAIDGSRPITLNVRGIEDVGDGSGTLITDVIQQYKHALKNWFVGDYQSGAWLDAPTFGDDATLPQIDEDSFDAASTVAAARIAGGYVGGGIIGANGERASLREWVARLNVSGDVDSSFNRRTQFMVSMENDDVAQLTGAVELTQSLDIGQATFEIEDLDDQHENVTPYAYGFNYRENKWDHESEYRDATSISNYEVELTGERVLLYMIPANRPLVALDIATRRNARTTDPPRLARLTIGLPGLNLELGQLLLLTHADGIGPDGWEGQPCRLVRHEFDPDNYNVRLEVVDKGHLF